jgi:hypothetical protein
VTAAQGRLGGWSRLSTRTRPAHDQTGSRSNQDTSVVASVGGGQDQAADAEAPVPLPRLQGREVTRAGRRRGMAGWCRCGWRRVAARGAASARRGRAAARLGRARGGAGTRSGRWCCAARPRPIWPGRRGRRGRAGAGRSCVRSPRFRSCRHWYRVPVLTTEAAISVGIWCLLYSAKLISFIHLTDIFFPGKAPRRTRRDSAGCRADGHPVGSGREGVSQQQRSTAAAGPRGRHLRADEFRVMRRSDQHEPESQGQALRQPASVATTGNTSMKEALTCEAWF